MLGEVAEMENKTKVRLMQGNEACAEGAIAAGLRFFAGYPITPSTEIAEKLAELLPDRTSSHTICHPKHRPISLYGFRSHRHLNLCEQPRYYIHNLIYRICHRNTCFPKSLYLGFSCPHGA